MNLYRKDLVHQVAIAAELTKPAAQLAVDAVVASLANGLIQRREIRLPGFGTFRNVHHDARVGRNPSTGEQIQIAAKDTPRFVPAKALKEAINPPPPSVPRRASA